MPKTEMINIQHHIIIKVYLSLINDSYYCKLVDPFKSLYGIMILIFNDISTNVTLAIDIYFIIIR